MLPILVIGLLVFVPVVLILLFRSNAAVVFLALCAGIVLLQYVGANAGLVLDAVQPRSSSVLRTVLNGTLLLLPALAAIILQRKKVSGLKLVLHVLPALATGGLVAVSFVPLLSPITRDNIMASPTWSILEGTQDLIVGGGVLASMLLLKPAKHKDSGKKHGK